MFCSIGPEGGGGVIPVYGVVGTTKVGSSRPAFFSLAPSSPSFSSTTVGGGMNKNDENEPNPPWGFPPNDIFSLTMVMIVLDTNYFNINSNTDDTIHTMKNTDTIMTINNIILIKLLIQLCYY